MMNLNLDLRLFLKSIILFLILVTVALLASCEILI